MRITLDRALFDVRSEEEAQALLALLATAVRDKHGHALLTDPIYVPGGDNQETDRWLSARPPFEQGSFRTLLANGNMFATGTRSVPVPGPRIPPALDVTQPRTWHLSGSLEIRAERQAASDWRNRVLTLADAADLMNEPVHLVLENARTDDAFLSHLAGPTDGATLRAAMDRPGRIVKHGAGSGEAKRWIEALTQGGPTPAQWRRMLRAWVLFDQDAGEQDALVPSRSAVGLMKACEKVVAHFGIGLSWICLCRREIESYVPDDGLRAESLHGDAPFVQQIISWRSSLNPLMPPYAWALDLKNGLRGDLRDALPQGDRKALKDGAIPLAAHMLKVPFNGLTAAEVTSLDGGLRDRLGEALRKTPAPVWSSDLPWEYDRGPSNQAPRPYLVQSLFDRM